MTLKTFNLPPDNRLTGEGDPPADMNAVVDAVTAMDITGNVLNAANGGGADPTGVADSTTAIQDALTSAATSGVPVYLPPGTYIISSTITLDNNRLLGAGATPGATAATLIKAATGFSGAMFNFTGAASEMGFLGITSANGGDILAGSIPGNSWFHDMALVVSGNNGSAVNVNSAESSINNTFERLNISATNGTRNAPMVSMWSSVSGNISNNTFYKCFFNNSGKNNTQFCCAFFATGAQTNYQYATVLRDCYFEHPFGGAVSSLAGQNFLMDSCFMWDIFAGQGQTMGNHLIVVGKQSGAAASQGAIIRNCGRNRDGPDGVSTWDIWCDSSTDGVIVEAYRARANTALTSTPVYFNFNTCANVTVEACQFPDAGNPGGTVVTGPPSNVTPAGQMVVSGQYLAAPAQYAPGSQTTVSVNSTSLAAFHSGVICTPSFTAPASGDVMVTVNCGMQISAGGAIAELALAATGTTTPLYGLPYSVQLSGTTTLDSVTAKFLVTGLTPGDSYQFDLLGAAASGDTASIIAFSAGSATTKGAPVTFEVQAV